MLSKEIQVEVDVLHRQGKGIRAIERETGLARTLFARSCAVSATAATAQGRRDRRRLGRLRAISKSG
jgi:transposase